MNIKSLKKDISSTAYKKGEHFVKFSAIRELEEVQHNKFIAFVDDGAESYDVCLELDANFAIILHTCDCGSDEVFCSHKAAVAVQLKDRGKSVANSVAKKIRAKKIDPLRSMIDDIHPDQIKDWVYELIKSNKEFHQVFKNRFEKNSISLAEKDIEEKHKEVFKAILKTAKYYDASQLQKILQLLSPFHQSVLQEVFLQEQISLLPLANILSILVELHERARKKTERLHKYHLEFLGNINTTIDQLPQQKLIALCENYFLELKTNDIDKLLRFSDQIFKKYLSLSTELTLKHIPIYIDIINKSNDRLQIQNTINELKQAGLINDYIHMFSMGHSMSANELIVATLVECGFILEAERLALDLLAKYPYYTNYGIRKQLVDIYTLNKDVAKKLSQVEHTVMTNFSYEEFAFVKTHMSKEAFSEFEKRFNRMIGQYKGNELFATFYMKKYRADENWKKMYDLIAEAYPLKVYEPYLDELYEYDKAKLFTKLEDLMFRYHYRDSTIPYRKRLVEIIEKYYGPGAIKN